MFKPTRCETCCFVALMLILAWCGRAHACDLSPVLTGNERGNDYTYTTGLTCYSPGGVEVLRFAVIHLEGEVVGGGCGFYDLKALDGYGVRVLWRVEWWQWPLKQGQRVIIVGRLRQAGRVDAEGYVPL